MKEQLVQETGSLTASGQPLVARSATGQERFLICIHGNWGNMAQVSEALVDSENNVVFLYVLSRSNISLSLQVAKNWHIPFLWLNELPTAICYLILAALIREDH